jgi:hypothetical protein
METNKLKKTLQPYILFIGILFFVGIGIFIYQQWNGNDNIPKYVTSQQTDSSEIKNEDSISPDSLAINELLIKKATLENLYHDEISGKLSGKPGMGEIAKNIKKQIDEIQIEINKIRYPNFYVQESQNDTINFKQKIDRYDDEILKAVEQAENYLLSNNKKSVNILRYHELRIKKLYEIKGLSDENNKLLSNALNEIRTEIKKIKEVDYWDNIINEDTLPKEQEDIH